MSRLIPVNRTFNTGAAGAAPVARVYRIPTSIAWADDGWREVIASSADEAMRRYEELWPISATHVSVDHLQVRLEGAWVFASDVEVENGGSDNRANGADR